MTSLVFLWILAVQRGPAGLPNLCVLFSEAKMPDHQKCELFLEVFHWDPSREREKNLLFVQ